MSLQVFIIVRLRLDALPLPRSMRTINAQEDERRRIARGLHDQARQGPCGSGRGERR